MAYSFLTYRDENIRVNDFDLVALVFLLKAAAFRRDEETKLNDVFANWMDSIENDGAGNIDLQLDKFLSTPANIAALVVASNNAKRALSDLPDIIPSDLLGKLIQVKGIEFGNYKKIFLENVLCSFDRLLKSAREALI